MWNRQIYNNLDNWTFHTATTKLLSRKKTLLRCQHHFSMWFLYCRFFLSFLHFCIAKWLIRKDNGIWKRTAVTPTQSEKHSHYVCLTCCENPQRHQSQTTFQCHFHTGVWFPLLLWRVPGTAINVTFKFCTLKHHFGALCLPVLWI